MKKHILGLAALIIGIGFSAFTYTPSPKAARIAGSYVWFQIKAGYGAANVLSDPQVTFLAPASPYPPSGSCYPGSAYYCVVGFDSTYVSGTHIIGSQPWSVLAHRRGTY